MGSHRDQILDLPPGAVLLARSLETPYEIWLLGENVLAVQGIPLSPAYTEINLLQHCRAYVYNAQISI